MATLNQFAWQLGAHARHTLDYSLAWHKAYVKATPETQAAWEDDFVVNFLLGFFKAERMTETQARKILATPRAKRTKSHEQVVNAAKAKFRYHISRKTSKHTDDSKPVAVPKALVNETVSAICAAQLTRAQFDAFLAQLRDSVQFK